MPKRFPCGKAVCAAQERVLPASSKGYQHPQHKGTRAVYLIKHPRAL